MNTSLRALGVLFVVAALGGCAADGGTSRTVEALGPTDVIARYEIVDLGSEVDLTVHGTEGQVLGTIVQAPRFTGIQLEGSYLELHWTEDGASVWVNGRNFAHLTFEQPEPEQMAMDGDTLAALDLAGGILTDPALSAFTGSSNAVRWQEQQQAEETAYGDVQLDLSCNEAPAVAPAGGVLSLHPCFAD